MKTFLLGLILIALFCSPARAQIAEDASTTQTVAAMADPFTGKILFHQEVAGVFYEVVITDGIVTGGFQHMRDSNLRISRIVGGWYGHHAGQLALLIQLTSHKLGSQWLSQFQQFHVDVEARQVTLEHDLHGYGLTPQNSGVATAHVLDSLEGVVQLVGAK